MRCLDVNFFKEAKTKLVLTQKPYHFLFAVWVLLFLALDVILNEVHIIGFGVLHYPLYIAIPYIGFTFLNALLIALVINLFILRIQEAKALDPKGGTLGAIGAFLALVTGACPGCIAGVFPALAGIFGSTLTLNSFPLYGVEIQVLSFVLLWFACAMLAKPMQCGLKKH